MDLYGLVSPVTSVVNAEIWAQWQRNIGYTTAADGSRTPVYAPSRPVLIEMQALSGRDLMQIGDLNIQGVTAAVYAPTWIEGVERPFSKGGDLLTITEEVPIGGAPRGVATTWLTTQVLERWPDFHRIAVVLQNGS